MKERSVKDVEAIRILQKTRDSVDECWHELRNAEVGMKCNEVIAFLVIISRELDRIWRKI